MESKSRDVEETLNKLLDRLNHALHMEYTFIIHYPYIVSFVDHEEAKKLAIELGVASIHHADVIAGIINNLGGNPYWSFEPLPIGIDVKSFFQNQLAKEKVAMDLHRGSAEMIASSSYSRTLNTLAEEEEQHIKDVQRILSLLNNQ